MFSLLDYIAAKVMFNLWMSEDQEMLILEELTRSKIIKLYLVDLFDTLFVNQAYNNNKNTKKIYRIDLQKKKQ